MQNKSSVTLKLKDGLKMTKNRQNVQNELLYIMKSNKNHLQTEKVYEFVKNNGDSKFGQSFIRDKLLWDDKKCGDLYRIDQIRTIIEQYVIVRVNHNRQITEGELLTPFEQVVDIPKNFDRQKLKLDTKGSKGWVPVSVLNNSKDLQAAKCNQFSVELQGFLNRWDTKIYPYLKQSIELVESAIETSYKKSKKMENKQKAKLN
jgi:hypothetical protein